MLKTTEINRSRISDYGNDAIDYPRPHRCHIEAPEDLIEIRASTRVRLPSSLRRIPIKQMHSLMPCPNTVQAGDLVLVRVEKVGKNTRLELISGRTCTLHEGDLLVAVFGNRYATNQFEGYARTDRDMCDMLSMGGMCGLVVSKHSSMPEPTKLRLLGSIADIEGRPLRLADFALCEIETANKPHVTVVCGTTMDSGKTHTVVNLIRGLKRANQSVAAIKLTGTACGRDTWKMSDAGASPVLDFIDGGHPSTYMHSLEELMGLYQLLLSHAAAEQVQQVVVEIADGVLQRETAALLTHKPFRETVHAWVLAAGDPLAAAGAVTVMRRAGIDPIAVSGLLTCSPLAMREAEASVGVRCFTADALNQGALNTSLGIVASQESIETTEAVA